MFFSILYVFLAVLGLGFLVFMHELGHYWMARRVGMRVETFSIGIGRPIVSWMYQGVKWQICWFLFGGYVKIIGTESDGEQAKDPHDIPDGFYGKSPWQRIKVAFMGPLTNLLLAFLFFGVIWMLGGRDKNFSEVTSHIGWVDPTSQLYLNGVRPGDEILSYNGHPFGGIKDHLYAAITGGSQVNVKILKQHFDDSPIQPPLDFTVNPYQNPLTFKKGIPTLGILAPANYIIYDRRPNGDENPLPEGSPLQDSGIQYGDRLVWVDGTPVFSLMQLDAILNSHKALLTVQRGNSQFLARVPRVEVSELRLEPDFREELVDWQFEANLKGTKIQNLYVIPYNLTNNSVVEAQVKFIDSDAQEQAFPQIPAHPNELALQPGDKILAVDGVPVEHSSQLLKQLQTRRVNMIVQRSGLATQKILSKQVDVDFNRHFNLPAIEQLANTIGAAKPLTNVGEYYLLNPVTPVKEADLKLSPEKSALREADLREEQKEIEGISDTEKRAFLQLLVKQRESRLHLGLPLPQDRKVTYNPTPTEMFSAAVDEIWRTLTSLVGGSMSLEWLSGPVGIVKVVHDNSKYGLKETLYWLGFISLNLGMLNLLPIPVLDGGTILLSAIELVTRRRINPKVLEWLVLPFAVLLITFFIFVTYNDILRIFAWN